MLSIRISLLWHNQDLGIGYSLLWNVVFCRALSLYPWSLPLDANSTPSHDHQKTSPDTAKCPLRANWSLIVNRCFTWSSLISSSQLFSVICPSFGECWGRGGTEVEQFAIGYPASKGAEAEFELQNWSNPRPHFWTTLLLPSERTHLGRKCREENLLNQRQPGDCLWEGERDEQDKQWALSDVLATFYFLREERRWVANSATC